MRRWRPTAGALLLAALGASACAAGQTLESALAAHDYPGALRILEPMLQSQPGNPRLLTLGGVLLAQLNRLPESLSRFDQALRISPKYLPALEGATEAAYRAGDARAADYARRVLALDPANSTAHAIAAALAFDAKDCPRAVGHFEKAAPAIAPNALAQAEFGQCLIAVGRPGDAAETFRQAARLKPDHTELRFNLALALHLAKRNADAVAVLRQLTADQPRDGDAWNLLAAAEGEAGDVPGALAALRKAIELDPRDARNYLDLGNIALEHSAYDAAIEVLTSGLAVVREPARLLTMRGALYGESGRLEQAQQDFEQAQRLEPDARIGPAAMSVLMTETARLPEATRLLRDQLARAPNDALLHYLLADALLRQGAAPGDAAFNEARQHLERAVAADARFVRARSALGKLLLKADERGAAIAQFDEAIRHNPADRAALNQLVAALRMEGRTDQAAAMARQLRKVIEDERLKEVERNRIRLVVTK